MVNLIGSLSVGQGDPGERIVIRNNNRISIDWKYETENDSSWRVIERFENLNGEEVELNVNATHIQWKYTKDSVWKNLIALSTITPSILHLEKDFETLSNNFTIFNNSAQTSESNRNNSETLRTQKFDEVIANIENTTSNAENSIKHIESIFDDLVDGTGFTSLEKFNNFKNSTGIKVISSDDKTPRNEGVFYFVQN